MLFPLYAEVETTQHFNRYKHLVAHLKTSSMQNVPSIIIGLFSWTKIIWSPMPTYQDVGTWHRTWIAEGHQVYNKMPHISCHIKDILMLHFIYPLTFFFKIWIPQQKFFSNKWYIYTSNTVSAYCPPVTNRGDIKIFGPLFL